MSDGPGTNPEELFAVGFAACFESALLGVARGRKLDTTGSDTGVGSVRAAARSASLCPTFPSARLPGEVRPRDNSAEPKGLGRRTGRRAPILWTSLTCSFPVASLKRAIARAARVGEGSRVSRARTGGRWVCR